MKIIKYIVATFTVLLLLTSCSKEKSTEEFEFKFLGSIKVEGTCYENHVKQIGNYTGSFRKVHYIKKNKYDAFGSVHQTGNITKRIIYEVTNPNKYHMPFMISFWSISEKDYNQSEMEVHGLSGSEGKNEFESTCILRVIERIDDNVSKKSISESKQ